VVNCFEGISSTESVATATIQIIDPGQFGKTPQHRQRNKGRGGAKCPTTLKVLPLTLHVEKELNFG
jgi:hypothetical protein